MCLRNCMSLGCVTMDGHGSNDSMCNQLRCRLQTNTLELLKTFFPHPVLCERVFVMMDACHMLKLAQNVLQAYSPITGTTGQITWTYSTVFIWMKSKQKMDFMLPTKVTEEHVYFDPQKTKVSLAVWTLCILMIGYSPCKPYQKMAEFISVILHENIVSYQSLPAMLQILNPLYFRN